MSPVDRTLLAEIAPTGPLRAAINLGNNVLAQQDSVTGALQGVTAELTRELADRLGLAAELVPFEAAGKAFEALKGGACDIAFLAVEPARAREVAFTAPYVLIEGTYLVPVDSRLRIVDDVDRAGVRIAVGPNSAYDLFLSRTLQHATIVRAEIGGGRAMIDLFLSQGLEAAAGVRQPLEHYAGLDPTVRVMDGRFMEIRQALALPHGRPAALRYLHDFIEEMKASGFVARALEQSGQGDAAVAPPDPA